MYMMHVDSEVGAISCVDFSADRPVSLQVAYGADRSI